MAAFRLGFCVAPEAVVADLEMVVLPYHLSVPTQLAGTVALRFTGEMDARVASIMTERDRVGAALAALDGVEAFPSGANFILFRTADGQATWEGLLEAGVLVRNFARWPRLDDCLRVTIGRPEENDAFLAALKEVLAMMHEPVKPQVAEKTRSTKETDISVRLDLDGTGLGRRLDRAAVLRPHAGAARPPRRVRPRP